VAEVAPRELRVDVTGILDELADTIDVEMEFALEPIELGPQRFTPTGPAELSVLLTYTGTGIVASGTVAVDVTTTCARCLTEFDMAVVGDIQGLYVRPGVEAEVPEEQEAEQITGRHIDLMPAVNAGFALALPFAPLHAPDCVGMCVTCGKDLAEGPCDCGEDFSRSPFAVLKDVVTSEDNDV